MTDIDVETFEKLADIARDYACHVHWRCEHQDRWPWVNGDCMCGLRSALASAGLPPEWADQAPVARG